MKKRDVWLLFIFAIIGVISFFFDEKISLFFKSINSSYLNWFFYLGTPLILTALVVIIGLILLWKKGFRDLFIFASTLVVSIIASFVLKFIFMRPRPFGLVESIALTNLPDYSFPSSHAFVAFACLPFLDKEFPKLKYLFIILAVIMVLSRIYYGMHYMSDIIFGSILGYLTGYAILKWYKKK